MPKTLGREAEISRARLLRRLHRRLPQPEHIRRCHPVDPGQAGRGLHRTIDEVCCGSVLQRIGVDDEDGGRHNGEERSVHAELGVEEVVFSCAGCYRMFKEEYPKHVEVPFKVRHISEYLAERDLKLRPLERSHHLS